MSTRTRTFKHKETLGEMLHLRSKGWNYKALASLYGVDHSSIYHLCKKYAIIKGSPNVSVDVFRIVEVSRPKDPVSSIVSISIRHKPVCYAEYL